MNFYEQIFSKGRATGEGMTHFERLFAAKFGGSPAPEVREYTGAVPVTITADGTPLLDYIISGNTVRNGTPTPDNPIMPQGCGDLETVGTKAGQYKIPISSAGQTTPVYLGEVETTRRIKKFVLTGRESGALGVDITNHIFAIRGIFNSEPELLQVGGVCTHYKYNNTVSNLVANMQNGDFVLNKIVNDYSFTIKGNNFNTADDFKTYLQQQYDAGTPVTVWYVLANEETGIVNEPLMRIGDYADTLSKAQAGVTIPTNNGSTTVDVDTTVKPSEVYIKYMG